MPIQAADHQHPPLTGLPGDELCERLATGTSVVVYRGVGRMDRKRVLLTTVASKSSSRDVSEFANEHSILMRLSGASIVHTLGHEVVEGRPWLVLEDVGGQPLSGLVARYRAP